MEMVIMAVYGVSGERMHELSAATESATESAAKHDQRQPGPVGPPSAQARTSIAGA